MKQIRFVVPPALTKHFNWLVVCLIWLLSSGIVLSASAVPFPPSMHQILGGADTGPRRAAPWWPRGFPESGPTAQPRAGRNQGMSPPLAERIWNSRDTVPRSCKADIGNLWSIISAKTGNPFQAPDTFVRPTSTAKILVVPVQFKPETNSLVTGIGLFSGSKSEVVDRAKKLMRRVSDYYAAVSYGNLALNVDVFDSTVCLPYTLDSYTLSFTTDWILYDVKQQIQGAVNFSNYDGLMILHAGTGNELTLLSGDIHSYFQKGAYLLKLGCGSDTDRVGISGSGCKYEFQTDSADLYETISVKCVLTLGGGDTCLYTLKIVFSLGQTESSSDTFSYSVVCGGAKVCSFVSDSLPYYHVLAALDGGVDVLGETAVSFGVVTHEFGHMLGLPDLYGTWTGYAGTGKWDLMATGNWNGSPLGDSPSWLGAWDREYLGWANVVTASSGVTNVNLEPAEKAATMYKIYADTAPTEYFLIEARYPAASAFEALPAAGILIWHIDNTVGSIASNDVNSYWLGPWLSGHNRVDLVEADYSEANWYVTSCQPWAACGKSIYAYNTTPSMLSYFDTANPIAAIKGMSMSSSASLVVDFTSPLSTISVNEKITPPQTCVIGRLLAPWPRVAAWVRCVRDKLLDFSVTRRILSMALTECDDPTGARK